VTLDESISLAYLSDQISMTEDSAVGQYMYMRYIGGEPKGND